MTEKLNDKVAANTGSTLGIRLVIIEYYARDGAIVVVDLD